MLSPEKYMDLDKSTIRIASLVLKYMGHRKVEKLDKVLSYVERKTGDGISENFLSALTLLYALGKIQYLEKNDHLRFVSQNETE